MTPNSNLPASKPCVGSTKNSTWRLAGLIALSAIVPLSALWVAIRWQAYSDPPLIVTYPKPAHTKEYVVVARRQEKSGPNDNSYPFRNSLVAIYRVTHTGSLSKISPDWVCRSTSTAEGPPSIPLKELSRSTTEPTIVRYGYHSFPLGTYNLTTSSLRGSSAYIISDWGRLDGQIATSTPQSLTQLTIRNLPDGMSVTTSTVTSYSRSQCFIHGTITQVWSDRDSYGCITLSSKAGPDGNSDWKSFQEILAKSMTAPHIGLWVVPAANVIPGDTNQLPDHLRMTEHGPKYF